MGRLKIFLDDTKPFPKGWLGVKTIVILRMSEGFCFRTEVTDLYTRLCGLCAGIVSYGIIE